MSLKRPHPDAVATKFGWALPKTGELLVSIRGLPVEVEEYKPNCPIRPTPKIVKEEPKNPTEIKLKPSRPKKIK